MRPWIAPLYRKLVAAEKLIAPRRARPTTRVVHARPTLTEMERRDLLAVGIDIYNVSGDPLVVGVNSYAVVCVDAVDTTGGGGSVTFDYTTVDGTARAGPGRITH